MPDTTNDPNKVVTLHKPTDADANASQTNKVPPASPTQVPTTPAKPSASDPNIGKTSVPGVQSPGTASVQTKPAPATDTRPTAPAPQTDTTQKPNPAQVVNRPTGGVFVGGPPKAMQPEGKHADVVAEQPSTLAWNHRGVVTNDNADDFIGMERMPGNLPFRGVCLKCGWQSQQPTEQAARDAVHRHLGRHIREAVA